MSSIGAVNLTKKNIFQGTLISCKKSSVSIEIKGLLADGRAIRSARNKPVSDLHLLLVLSQDCDISNTKDHFIEVIAIKKVPEKKVGELQQKNRNYRKLQLPYDDDYWLCEADLISVVNKGCLAGKEIEIVGTLNDYSKEILIDWRIGRYDRVPFPDKFNRYFIGKCLKGPESDFEDFLVKFRKEIIDLYLFVDPKNEEQADEYAVSITALLSEECSSENESNIEEYIRSQCQNLHDSEIPFNMMQIDSSFAPNDLLVPQDFVLKMSDFSFLDATVLRRITLDYLCYHDTEEE